jgi:hypothetical protein
MIASKLSVFEALVAALTGFYFVETAYSEYAVISAGSKELFPKKFGKRGHNVFCKKS